MSSQPVSDATGRLEERRRRDRRRGWTKWVAALAAAGVVAALVFLVWFSSVLALREIVVSGNKILDTKEIVKTADVTKGTPLARIDIAAVAYRVSGLPAVAEVEVSRSWPGTVRIVVTERQAKLAIQAGGGYLIADANGVVFESVRQRPSSLVMVSTNPRDAELLVEVGVVFQALSPDTARQVSRIEAATPDSIVLRLDDGSRVIWGNSEDSELKSEVLEKLLPLGGSVFNVSVPGYPSRR